MKMRIKSATLIAVGVLFAPLVRADEVPLLLELEFKSPQLKAKAQDSFYYARYKTFKLKTKAELPAQSKEFLLKDIQSKGFVKEVLSGQNPETVAVAVASIGFNEKENVKALLSVYTVPQFSDEAAIDENIALAKSAKVALQYAKVVLRKDFGDGRMVVFVDVSWRMSPLGTINMERDLRTYFAIPLKKEGRAWKTTFKDSSRKTDDVEVALDLLGDVAAVEGVSLFVSKVEEKENTKKN